MDVQTQHQPEDWITYFKEEDERQLKTIYAANFPKIRDYVLDNSGTEADAKDIYHEAFISVWRNIQLDRVVFASIDKFQGYLFRVAQYNWIDQLRKKKRSRTVSIDTVTLADVPDTMLSTDEEEYIETAKKRFRELGDPCRDLLYRFYFLKQKLKEIASIFNWTEATAKNNKYRCLEKLRNSVFSGKNQ